MLISNYLIKSKCKAKFLDWVAIAWENKYRILDSLF